MSDIAVTLNENAFQVGLLTLVSGMSIPHYVNDKILPCACADFSAPSDEKPRESQALTEPLKQVKELTLLLSG